MPAFSWARVAPEGRVGGRGRCGADGHQQRKQPAMVASRVDVQLELNRMDLGPFLVGSKDAGLRAGNGDCAGQVGIIGVQHIVTIRRGFPTPPTPHRGRLRCAPATSSATPA